MVAETVSYSDIANRQVGLGIAVVITGLLAGTILQLTRRVRQMPAYFKSNFTFFSDKNPKLLIVAAILYYLLLVTPIVLLAVWVIILGVNVGANPALPVLFIGIFIIFIFLPSQSRLFYFKVLAMFIAYVTAEMLALGLVFDGTSDTSFWALTAIALTINSIFVILAMWFMDDRVWSIPNDTPSSLKQKIRAQVKIWKQADSPPEIIDGGLYGKVAQLRFAVRMVIIAIIYLLSLLVLLTYTLIGKYHTIYNFQALVNSVAMIISDIVTFMLMVISKKHGFDPNINGVVVVAVRVCIIAFSGQFWFLGFCLLYLILMVYISVLIINKFYPTYEKPPSAEVTKTNLFKMPQTAGIILILMFSALVYYMGRDEGKTLPITHAQLGEGSYPFWAIGVATILLSFAVFFYLISSRIVLRSQMKVRSTNLYFLGCQFCGEYYFFVLAAYAFLVVLGFHLFSVVQRNIIWASCVFLPVFYEAFLIFYSNWKENDYLILGDIDSFNKKLKKRKQRQEKIIEMRKSVVSKMKQQGQAEEQMIAQQSNNLRVMDNAVLQSNWVLQNYDVHEVYSQWRDEGSIVQAIKSNKLLPTDRRILISIPIMIGILIGYSLTFFFTQDRSITAFTVSVEIIVLFLIFIPVKRYFSTFEKPNVFQIVLFVVGFVINYAYGILTYVFGLNTGPGYTVLWTFINPFLVFAYAGIDLIRDKGIVVPTIIVNVVSMVLSFGPGIILLAWFNMIPVGVALIGAGFYYTYFLATFMIYTKMNNSVPFAVYPITIIIILLTCCAVMIYAFVDTNFDDFYGFSITYLVINLLILLYAIYRVGYDILTRADKPNFYSPYGLPIYKYDFNIKSVVANNVPIQVWLVSWFFFYIYTILMQIFIFDTNYGTSASMIPLIIFSLTFFYFVTYNLNLAGKIKDDITNQIQQSSWEEVLKTKDRNLGNILNLDELQKQFQQIKKQQESGQQSVALNVDGIKIQPKQEKMDNDNEHNQTSTKINPTQTGQKQTVQISQALYDLEIKIQKAVENDKILLVNFWTMTIFKTESKRKRRMMEFTSFIKDCGDLLAGAGIALILNDTLYDLQLIYNQAFQEFHTLSPIQRVYFNKNFKLYLQRKQKEQKESQQVNRKEQQNMNKRQKQLQKKILNNKDDKQDPNLPVQKMRDGPEKFKKLKQTLNAPYSDPDFRAFNDYIPNQIKATVKGWKRPSKDSVIMKNLDNQNLSMSVRQGMIGNCYLISAIGVLGKQRIASLICQPSSCPPGAYMVKFNKFNKDIYIIIDDNFPVIDNAGENQWIFGRCQSQKQLFCNIIEKAYAKLYGGYQNIVGGKVALALSDMTGGFPEEIQLKPYQQTNTNQIFQKMIQFKNAGYLMGAGSPPNAKGDAVLIDGIYQGHAYLILDVRNLDGNKLIKLRNPHGNQSKQSTLDWSDDSPKWTSRLKGLLGQKMAADGAFWMSLDDFVYCYRALYVCRIFDNTWTRAGPFYGQWKGKTAAGLKSSKGSVQLENNPHYGIKVSKACTLFVKLNQNQMGQSGSGKNKIFFMVQRNAGKRIQAPATNKMAGMSGPAINSRTISKQINLTADSFPYTFSLMTSIYEAGVQGTFSLQLYCNDKNIQVIDNALFDQ